MNTLYVSYDGVLEPLGQSQIMKYVLGLSPIYRQVLITFEKAHDLKRREQVLKMEETLSAAGVRWIHLRYHKWPLIASTAWDVLVGVVVCLYVCRTVPVQVLHARGYVPALIAIFLKRVIGIKFLFDMRGFWADEKRESRRLQEHPGELRILFAMEGFWADERVVAGQWSERSLIYKITKRCEKVFFESADAIVSLTVAGAKAIPDLGYAVPTRTPIVVIPTCTDLEGFKPGPKNPVLLAQLGLADHLVVGCVGTLSNWYLREAMLQYLAFLASRLDNVKVLIVTREDHDRLRNDAMQAGLQPSQVVLTQAEFSAMPDYIRLIDAGLFFIRACFGKKGSNATKLGEFLGCGAPVIINDGVGDSGWIVRENKVGVVLSDTTPQEFWRSLPAVKQMLNDPSIAERCRETAKRYFDVDMGINKYTALYQALLADRAPAQDRRDR